MTDPDSRKLFCKGRYLQGYNAQAAVSDDQVIVATDVTNNASDATVLEPMVRAARETLSQAKAPEPTTFLADTGYWSPDALNALGETTDVVLPPPERANADPKVRQQVLDAMVAGEIDLDEGARRLGVSVNRAYALRRQTMTAGSTETWRRHMRARLETDEGRALYRRRRVTVAPVFGNIKANLGFRSAHNLLKLRQHRLAI